MKWYYYLPMLIMFLGVGELVCQLYKMIVIDAEGRGLKHPKFWGFFALSGNNSSGLLLYLLGRRNYPRTLTRAAEEEMENRRKKALVGLVFLAVGAVALAAVMVFGL